MQGNSDLSRAVEELRRSTFALIERAGAAAATPEDRCALVALQRAAYELGFVESLLEGQPLRAA